MSGTDISTEVVTEENYNNVIQELEDAFYDIPFDNSAFQTEAFVVASQITPERAYRAIGLRMNAKLRALNEAKFGRMKEEIDIQELQEKIDNPYTLKWDKQRAEVDIQQKLSNRWFTNKLINDALNELNVLYKHFRSLPKYTREQFEQGEATHFNERLNRQLTGIGGARESLVNMTNDLPSIVNFEERYVDLLLSNDAETALKLLNSTPDVTMDKE